MRNRSSSVARFLGLLWCCCAAVVASAPRLHAAGTSAYAVDSAGGPAKACVGGTCLDNIRYDGAGRVQAADADGKDTQFVVVGGLPAGLTRIDGTREFAAIDPMSGKPLLIATSGGVSLTVDGPTGEIGLSTSQPGKVSYQTHVDPMGELRDASRLKDMPTTLLAQNISPTKQQKNWADRALKKLKNHDLDLPVSSTDFRPRPTTSAVSTMRNAAFEQAKEWHCPGGSRNAGVFYACGYQAVQHLTGIAGEVGAKYGSGASRPSEIARQGTGPGARRRGPVPPSLMPRSVGAAARPTGVSNAQIDALAKQVRGRFQNSTEAKASVDMIQSLLKSKEDIDIYVPFFVEDKLMALGGLTDEGDGFYSLSLLSNLPGGGAAVVRTAYLRAKEHGRGLHVSPVNDALDAYYGKMLPKALEGTGAKISRKVMYPGTEDEHVLYVIP